MAMNNRIMRPRASGVKYHAEAVAWRTAAIANGGIVSKSTMQAVSNFCTAIDAAGIRDRFVRLSLLAGSNIEAAQVPLYRGTSPTGTQYGAAADVNNGPITTGQPSGPISYGYWPAWGLYGDGASQYLDTNVTFTQCQAAGMAYEDCHMAYWYTSSAGLLYGQVQMGVTDSSGVVGSSGLAMYANPNYAAVFIPGQNEGDTAVYSDGNFGTSMGGGLHFGTRYGSGYSDTNFVVNGTDRTGSINATSVNWNSPNALTIPIGALYDPDFGYAYGGQAIGSYSFGIGMSTQAQWTAYSNAMSAAMTALGRTI